MTTPAQPRQLAKMKTGIVYKDYQIEGIRWLIRSGNSLLCDDMGLGKTLESLTVAAADFERGIANKVLVVTLSGLKPNWAAEIKLFTHFTYEILDGPPKKREKQLANFDKEILITHYEQLIPHWEQINAIGFDVVISDEAHMVNNSTAQRTKAWLKIEGKRHIPMTGSPLLGSPMNLWTLFKRIDPELYPNKWKYRNRYCALGGYGGKQVIGVKNERELNAVLSKCMLRRLKKDVLDLSEPQDIPVWVDMHDDQRKMYDIVLKDQLEGLSNNLTPLQIENSTQRFVALTEICGSLGTVEGMPDSSGKLDAMFDKIVEIVLTKPTVVFTRHLKIWQLIMDRAAKLDIPIWGIRGDTKNMDRFELIDQWTMASKAGHHGIMLSMFQVGGTGFNMTAASTVHMPDRLWVPKLNEQAVSRVHRIGQDDVVQVFRYMCTKSIDSRVEKINAMKEQMNASVVEGDPTWKQQLIKAMLEPDEDD
jgi:SNF2 family DNA or RNA helicase